MHFVRHSRSVFLAVALLGGLVLAAALLGGLARGAPAVVAAPSQALALGSPGNENWAAFDTGPNGNVRVLTFDSGGNLYVGGDFLTAGGVTVTRVAKFDGSTWSGFGDGLSGGTGRVHALVVSGSTVYAGGTFITTTIDTPVTGVAKWNGSAWEPLCNGTVCGVSGGTPAVFALAMDSAGNLYVGGNFITAGGVTVNRIAKWDGAQWSALGNGFDNGQVNALVVSGTVVYAGGTFTATGGVPVTRTAMWDGAQWQALGTTGPNGTVNALALDSKGNLYVAGSFSSVAIGGVITTVNRIAKWDGTAWSALGTCPNCGLTGGSTARALAVDSADNLYVAGNVISVAGGTIPVSHTAKWNGSIWSALGSGLNNDQPYALVFRDGYLYVGGNFTATGGVSTTRIARWTAAEGRAITGAGTYIFYPPTQLVTTTLPVTITVTTQGDLARINMQRFNTNHPSATAPLQTGYYWQLEGLNASGNPATGFTVNLTLPANGFTPDVSDKVCYHTGSDWNCAMNSYNATSITRNGITSFSDWTTGNFTPTYTYLPIIMRQ